MSTVKVYSTEELEAYARERGHQTATMLGGSSTPPTNVARESHDNDE